MVLLFTTVVYIILFTFRFECFRVERSLFKSQVPTIALLHLADS